MREEPDILDDVPDPPAQLNRVDARDVLFVQQDPARADLDQPVHHPQDRRLAAPGRADQHRQLPGRQLHRQVTDGDGTAGELLADALESDRHGSGSVHVMPPPVTWAMPDDPRNPWFSWEYVRQNIDSLTTALQQHVTLTLATIAVAALLGIPLAVVAHRYGRLAGPILSLTGVLYTIPSLALFALLGPLLGLSFGTALIGLVLYALLSVVRNALTGLR